MQTPKFLRDLLQSNNYWNKNSTEFTKANEYLEKLYPGQLQKDASGNYTEPEFDMTYEQFLDAQKKIDDDIQDAIQEAQDDIPEVPVHPNCRCWVEEIELDDKGKPISSKVYKGQKPDNKTDKNETQNMKMSDKGINWLKDKEDKVLDKQGCHIIYDDKTRKPVVANEPLPRGATIGYGHLIKQGENFRNGISEAKATELLRADIAIAERAVRDNISVPLSQNQFDALVSLAYNIGTTNFSGSTVVKYINNSNFHSAEYPNLESAWKAWNRSQGSVSNGLINRRKYEWNLYKNGIY